MNLRERYEREMVNYKSTKDRRIADINSTLDAILSSSDRDKVYLETENGIKLRSDVHDIIVTLYTEEAVQPGKIVINGFPTGSLPTLILGMAHKGAYEKTIELCKAHTFMGVEVEYLNGKGA